MAETEVNVIVTLRDAALRKLKRLRAGTTRVAGAFRAMGRKGSEWLGKIGEKLTGIRKRLQQVAKWGGIAAAAFAVFFARRMIKAIIEVGSKYEALKNQILISFQGIRSEATSAWKAILDFAARSPLMTDRVVAAFATLKAAGIENATEVTKALGSLALVFGREIDTLAAMFLGAQQRVFRRMGILIDRQGKKAVIQTGAFKIAVDKDMRSIWKGLFTVIKESFGGAMKLAQDTWDGAVKTMMGKWDVFLNKISEAGFLDILTASLQTFNTEMDKLEETGRLDEIAKKISASLVVVVEVLIEAVAWVLKMRVGVARLRVAWHAIVGVMKSALFIAMKPGIALVAGMTKAVDKLRVSWKGVGSILLEQMKDLKAIFEAIGSADPSIIWERIKERAREVRKIWDDPTGLSEVTKEIQKWEKRLDLLVAGGGSFETMNKALADLAMAQKDVTKAEEDGLSVMEKIKKRLAELVGLRAKTLPQVREAARLSRIGMDLDKRIMAIEKQKTDQLKQQKELRERLVSMSNEEAAKVEWIAKNAHMITAEFLAQNEDMRGVVEGHRDLAAVFPEELRGAKDLVEAEGQRAIQVLAAARGRVTPTGIEATARAESAIAQRAAAAEMARRQPVMRLEANIQLLNNPEINVQINMNEESVIGKLSQAFSESMEALEIKLNARLKGAVETPAEKRSGDVESEQAEGMFSFGLAG